MSCRKHYYFIDEDAIYTHEIVTKIHKNQLNKTISKLKFKNLKHSNTTKSVVIFYYCDLLNLTAKRCIKFITPPCFFCCKLQSSLLLASFLFLIQIFMGSSTGNLLVDHDEALRNIFKNSRVLIATHCEDNALINRNMEEFKAKYGEENLKPYMHPLIRNHKACYKSSKKAVDLALETGANLHVLHLSTKDEIELFRPFACQPVRDRKITAEVCAHHMFFNDKDYERLGNRLKCNPAVKTEEDRQALVNAVEQGIISIIATDHAPHTIEEKNQPFSKAPSGLPLIQFSLLAVLDLVHRDELSIEAAVTALSHNPAERFNIDRRGYIREGYFADIVIVKKNDYTVKPVDIASKCKWSPFLGHTFSHRVMHTFVNGNHVVTNGIFTPNNIFGRDLRFNR